jgi:hypothetical protein
MAGDVIGKLEVDGVIKTVKICDVTYLQNGKFNLFSISQMLNKGWKMKGSEDNITISKDKLRLYLEKKL